LEQRQEPDASRGCTCFQGSTLDVAKRKSTLGPALPHFGFCSNRTGCCHNNHTQQSRIIAVNDGRMCRIQTGGGHDYPRLYWASLGLVQRPVFGQVGSRAAPRHPTKHGTCGFDPRLSCAKLFRLCPLWQTCVGALRR
jgi:hypothetical protein